MKLSMFVDPCRRTVISIMILLRNKLATKFYNYILPPPRKNTTIAYLKFQLLNGMRGHIILTTDVTISTDESETYYPDDSRWID